jgi:hypothetical protein
VVVEADELRSEVSVITFWLMFCKSSNWLNWASCVTNCVLSAGLSGSWFFNCVTSSVKNVLSFASPVFDDEELVFAADEDGSDDDCVAESGEIAVDIRSSLSLLE